MTNEVKSIGLVDGRLVYPGDKLYVDIRGTCATEWGKPKVAHRGANEGQGPMIIFEDGDYRMCERLVWEPTPLEPRVQSPARQYVNTYDKPENYTREELVKILTAFHDITSHIPEDDYVAKTNDSCVASKVNYGEAIAIMETKRPTWTSLA